MKEALLYKKEHKNRITCFLCNHNCSILENNLGFCRVRKNIDGKLYSLNYGKLVAANIDPIEKKPLYHFLAGSYSYSIACVGCNFKCDFCQNWQISQIEEAIGLETLELNPEDVVKEAMRNKCPSISYTYTEPTVYFEFAYDCAKLAKEKGIFNVFVTNGYMSKESIEYIKDYLDAANIDLKSFSDNFYRKFCKGRLNPVLENIKFMKELGIWVEVTTLIIPKLNDSKDELESIANFLASIDKNIPWHVSAFHPDYKLIDIERTPTSTLDLAYKIGKKAGLNFVYIGNVYSDYGSNTYCPNCSKEIIKRIGFFVEKKEIYNNRCRYCQKEIPGLF